MSTAVPTPASSMPSPGPPEQACLAVSPDGTLVVDADQIAPILEKPPTASSRLRTIVLNRPKALNALDTTMVRALHSRISALDQASTVDGILLRAVPGRAFCAGGDIRSLYEEGKDGDYSSLSDYFRYEYAMDNLLGNLRNTTLISLLDGIVMGGGVGISVHGKIRVVTEKTVFAMPECAIGLFPDIGIHYVLAKLPGGLGSYISLTGARLKGTDSSLLDAGIATHFVPSHLLGQLADRLASINTGSPSAVSRAIAEFSFGEPLPPMQYRDVIDECFGGWDSPAEALSAEKIVERLRNVEKKGGESGQFASTTLATMLKGCPTSVKVSLEALKRAKTMSSLSEALRMDFRLAVRMSRRPDFYAGVCSAIVTKDRNPQWSPSVLSDVSDADVEALFEPLAADLGIPELDVSLPPAPESRSRM